MSRFTYGPKSDSFTAPGGPIVPVEPPPSGKPDVVPTFKGFDPTQSLAPFTITQAAFDPSTVNPPIAYHAVIVPTGTPLPPDPADLLESNADQAANIPLNGFTGGGDITIAVPMVGLTPGGSYYCQGITEFAS